MNVTRHRVVVTTDTSQDAIAYTPALKGQLVNIIYTKDDFVNGVDFAITAEGSGLSLWGEANVDASKTVSPRQPAHSQAGVALLYAAVGEAVTVPIFLAGERVKIVIDEGGSETSGTFDIIVVGPTG